VISSDLTRFGLHLVTNSSDPMASTGSSSDDLLQSLFMHAGYWLTHIRTFSSIMMHGVGVYATLYKDLYFV
jgi:hypothetical protein